MSSKIHYVGHLQRPNGKPENVEIIVDERPNLTSAERAAGIKWVNPRYEPGNVLRYGAVGDGVTDDSTAIQAALDSGVNKVYIPSGTYILGSEPTLTSSHNGITVIGDGYTSELKLIGSSATNLRAILIQDAGTIVQDITIANLRLNGNQSNRTSTGSRGIWTNGSAGTFSENITIKNIWAHDFDLEGISLNGTNAIVSQCYLYDNQGHGIAVSATSTSAVVGDYTSISDIWCSGNGGYGLNISASPASANTTTNLNNFYLGENTQGGFKLAGRGTINMSNGYVYNNTAKGGRGQEPIREWNMTNVHFFNNGGFNLDVAISDSIDWASTTAYSLLDIVRNDSGKLYICTSAGTSAGSGGPTGRGLSITDSGVTWDYWPMMVNLTNITSKDAGGTVGINIDDGTVLVKNIQDDNSAGVGIFVTANCERLVVDGFSVSNSQNASVAIDVYGADRTFMNGVVSSTTPTYSIRAFKGIDLKNIEIISTNGINSNNIPAGERLLLDNVDFSAVSGTQISDVTDPIIVHRDCAGLSVATPSLDDTGTPSVLSGKLFKTGGTTAITDFDDGVVGQTIKILGAHSVTITDGAPIILAGGANFAMVATDTLTLTMFDDQVWQEVSRSVN